MPSSTIQTFTDPDPYHAEIRGQHVEGVVTGRGDFQAQLTRIDFDRLLMQRADENLPRVLNWATASQRAAIIFFTHPPQSVLQVGGRAMGSGEIIVWDSGSPHHHRSASAISWATMSMTQQDLAFLGEAIAGRELTAPSFPHRIKPPVPLLSRLLNLHEAASHLAKTAPDILAKPEVARAMEQGLAEAMVACLSSGDPVHERSTFRHHARVMSRLEEMLCANSEWPLYMADLCTATGTSYRTLRDCCQEHLGMGPKRYLLLRRMHLAQRALRSGDAESTTVTEIATKYGFWELGRFSVAYRSLFGESPSLTLRRRPEDPQPIEISGSLREFAEFA